MNNEVYVWASYAVTFALLALEVILLRRRWRRLSR